MATDPPPIGRKLRRAMERARMDQKAVARALGVSRSAVNAWINDRAYPMNSVGALEDLLPTFRVDGPDEDEDAPAEPEGDAEQLRREVQDLRETQRQLRAEMQAWREVALEGQKGKGNGNTEARRAI